MSLVELKQTEGRHLTANDSPASLAKLTHELADRVPVWGHEKNGAWPDKAVVEARHVG